MVSTTEYQLAQLNVAEARADKDSALMAGFVARLDEINKLAESSPGFVWRLVDNDSDPTAAEAFPDPRYLLNLSVWNDIQTLKAFVYRTAHVELLRQKQDWFYARQQPSLVMWWVAAGHKPSMAEAKQRLLMLAEQGPGKDAFDFSTPFTASGDTLIQPAKR